MCRAYFRIKRRWAWRLFVLTKQPAMVMYLDRARQMAAFILTELKNPAGGFYDICAQDSASLKLRLTLIEQNGAAASFFLSLAQATKDAKYRDAAHWALAHRQ